MLFKLYIDFFGKYDGIWNDNDKIKCDFEKKYKIIY